MPEIIILTESELRQCVSLNQQTHDLVEHAFKKLAEEGVIMPAVLSMQLPEVNGEVDVKTAYIPGLDTFAIKVSPGFFDNPLKGLNSLSGLMIALSTETGNVKAILLDNGYLTDVRTAAAGGVAARFLAPQNAATAGIIGTGVQARLQAKALLIERDVKNLLVWGRSQDKAEAYAAEQTEALGIPVEVAESAEFLVRNSQVVVTTTPTTSPIIQSEWLHSGLHITAIGSDSPEKNELDPKILVKAKRFIVDIVKQSQERGEIRSAIEADLMQHKDKPHELGELCLDESLRRQSDEEITVCDLTGAGIQDTAIANYALDIAKEEGFGAIIDS